MLTLLGGIESMKKVSVDYYKVIAGVKNKTVSWINKTVSWTGLT